MVRTEWGLFGLETKNVGGHCMRQISRRAALTLGAGSAALTIVGWGGKANITGWGGKANAAVKEAAAEIAKFTGGKTAESGKVAIELPEIAENGNTVPLSVSIDMPMTADNYVSEVLVVAATRIRLATTQNIIVVAKTSGGQFFTGQKLVKVTIGGCGG